MRKSELEKIIDDFFMTSMPIITDYDIKRYINPVYELLDIEQVIFHNPATIVKFKDGTKIVSKTCDGDVYNKEMGFIVCLLKRIIGKKEYNKIVKKWVYPKEKECDLKK